MLPNNNNDPRENISINRTFPETNMYNPQTKFSQELLKLAVKNESQQYFREYLDREQYNFFLCDAKTLRIKDKSWRKEETEAFACGQKRRHQSKK